MEYSNFSASKVEAYNDLDTGTRMYQGNPNDNKKNFDPVMHDFNVKRRIMERDGAFNVDTRLDRYRDPIAGREDQFNENAQIGEITGELLDTSNLDQGMPMRHFLNQPIQQPQDYNPNLDFDLYQSKPNSSISYFDPAQLGGFRNFSDLGADHQLLPPINTKDAQQLLGETSNQFSLLLYEKFNEAIPAKKSMVISPFSLMSTMTMLYRGSKGGTEEELRSLFGFQDKQTTTSNLAKLVRSLNNTRSMATGQAIFFPKTFPLNKAFVDYVRDLGVIDVLNTSQSRSESIKINHLIQKMTRNTIKDVIQPQVIDNNSSMILISTIFFYSKWKVPFDPMQTTSRPFFSLTQRNIPLMTKVYDEVDYYEDNVNQVMEMQFADEEFLMGIILPKNHGQLVVNNEQISFYIKKLRPTHMNMIQIPKFKHQSKFKVDNLFRRLGLRDLFTNADLGEITPSNNILYISDIIHQSYIVVNEAGMKQDRRALAMKMQNKPMVPAKNFIANHPFIYYIRHRPSNVILLLGHYY